MRCAVVGGGILGLATARALALRGDGTEVVLLEKEAALGRHQTGHNSGVVHAGIYYAPGSLKARLCRRGVGLMRDFCAAHDLPYEACGKLVVATEGAEVEPLHRLAERAERNGVPGLRWLEGAALQEVEPRVQGVAALHSPETAITDFGAVAAAMAADLRAAGAEVRCATTVTRVGSDRSGARLQLAGGELLEADRAIVCAGLWSDRLARASGQPTEPHIVPFRGEYWKLRPERADLVRGLIYPVPDPSLPFLGMHLTRKIGGDVLLGPNAVMALALEGYRRRDVSLAETAAVLGRPGTWRMMRTHWRAGLRELSQALRKRAQIREARRFVPELRAADAVRAPAGVRAQAVDGDGSLVDDFRLGRDRATVWVRNAPSPAATSSLAIAEELIERL